MHVGSAVVLLLLLAAGCVRHKPDTSASDPQIAAKQPAATQATEPAPPVPVAKPTPPAPSSPAAKPAAQSPTQSKPAPPPAPSATIPVPPAARPIDSSATIKPAATPTLDLNALTEEVKSTSAIGFFTKLTLKNKVDDLLDDFRDYHEGKSKLAKIDLRRSYELLVMKLLSLLQDKDPRLAASIVSSREAIWDLLADPKKFASLPS